MVANLLGLLIFGSLILLGIIQIANPLQVNKRANIWFGIFLFFWASFWLEEIMTMTTGSTIELGSVSLLGFIQLISPLSFYISIRYFTNPEYKIGQKDLIYLILPLFYLPLFLVNNILDMDVKVLLIAFLPINGLVYTVLSLLLIRTHKRHIQQFASNTLGIDLRWLEYIVWAALFMVIAISIFNLLFFDAPLNVFMNGFVYMVVLFTAFHSLKQKEIFPADRDEREEALSLFNESSYEGIQNKLIPADKLVDLKSQLKDIITKEELYLDSELSLGKLAKKLNISSHQLSYVLNNGFNQNFYSFINTLRVEKAKKLLADKELDKYSIIGIAFESGFNSKTSFNTTFKRLTGQTPSEFKKTCSPL